MAETILTVESYNQKETIKTLNQLADKLLETKESLTGNSVQIDPT